MNYRQFLKTIPPYILFTPVCVAGLMVCAGFSEDWPQKLMRVKMEALVRAGTEQSADDVLGMLSQVQDWL